MEAKKKKNLLIIGGSIGLVVLAVVLSTAYGTPPKTTGKSLESLGYYTGPMRNKRGDLVTDDGKVLEKAKTPTTPNLQRMD